MFPNIPWWVFIVVGAAIGGPAGVILGAKAATKKYLIMKAVTGALAGGAMGAAFGMLGSGGGEGFTRHQEVIGNGAYVISINAETSRDRIDNIRLDFLISDNMVERANLKRNENISDALHDFSQVVAQRSDGNIVRINQGDTVPRSIMDQVIEQLRLGGVRLSLEVPDAH